MDTSKIIIAAVIIITLAVVIKLRNRFDKLRRAIKAGESGVGIYSAQRDRHLKDALTIAKMACRDEVYGIERLTSRDQLAQLMVLGQKYPSLANSVNYTIALQKAHEVNDNLSAAERLLDADIGLYNDQINAFPANIVAKILGYKTVKFIDEDNSKANRSLQKDFDYSMFI